MYSTFDLRSSFNQVLVNPPDAEKTAFLCRSGLFECVVMPFGLTNAPATMQAIINRALHGLADVICVVYVDDIFVFSCKGEDHTTNVRRVLERLIAHNLFVKAEKCSFNTRSVSFLGHIISPGGISMDPSRTCAIRDFPPPTSLKTLQQFLGFANSYRRYIPHFASLARPLTALTTKAATSSAFSFPPAASFAFDALKAAFASTLTLRHFDPSRRTVLETDSSGFAIAGILSQDHDDGLRPIAFWSRQTAAAERNYGIRDQELLAIVESVRQWTPYLESCQSPFTIYSDHQALQYFQSSQPLTPRHIRWSQDLNSLSYFIKYRPARFNCAADTLSRQPNWEAAFRSSPIPSDPVLRPIAVLATSSLPSPTTPQSTLSTTSSIPHNKTTSLGSFSARLASEVVSDATLPQPLPSAFTTSNSVLLYQSSVYVPPSLRAEALYLAHDAPTAGHPGRDRTLNILRRAYNWPGAASDCAVYVASCDACQKSKPSRVKPYGPTAPLPVASGPWSSISWDYIGPLPLSRGFNAILVIVDRFTKSAHFVPASTNDDSRALARHYVQNVVRLHGYPDSIILDRGTTFSSAWWKAICALTGTDVRLSTAFHPQTDGQTERTNQTVEHMLRCYCNYLQDDWSDRLPLAEFAYNSSRHSAVNQSPFHALYGYNPRDALTASAPLTHSAVPDASARVAALASARDLAVRSLHSARSRMESLSTTRRSPAPDFKVGDQVLVSGQHISSTRPTKKLDDRFLGPYTITERVGPHNF